MERETPITLLIIDSDTQWLEYIAPTLQQAGFEVLTVIVLLAEENQDYALLAGFEAGADDFIYKRLKTKLFIYKLEALVKLCFQKRKEVKQPLVYGDFSLDEETYTLTKGDRQYVLTKKEYELLSLLLSAPNRLFSREEIATHIWADPAVAHSRTIDVHIGKLRDKLGQARIKTVKGVGYRLVY